MAQKTISKFSGGISSSQKSGLPNSFRFAKHLDIFSDDDSVTLLPKTTKISGTIVVDQVGWIASGAPYNTNKYAYGSAGKFYGIDSSNAVTLIQSVASSSGEGLIVFDDFAYIAGQSVINRYGRLSGTPGYTADFFTNGVFDLDQSNTTATGQIYTVTTGINEGATHKLLFTPTKSPITKVDLKVTTKGTGNLVLTIHDADNVVLGTQTLANGAITGGGAVNTFTFSSQLKNQIGYQYHMHIQSTVADSTIQTGTASDFSTAYYKQYNAILFSDTGYHSMIQHTNGVTGIIAIANGNYIATWDGTTYSPNEIQIEPGFIIRSFERENEFIVAYALKGSDVTTAEEAKIYYWDGIQPYYNYSKPVTGGAPNAMLNYKNRLLSVLGGKGILTLGTEPFRTIQPLPGLARGKTIQVQVTGVTTWQNRAHIAAGVSSTDSAFIQGVYEYGNQSDRAVSYTSVSSEVLNFAYTISTGDETGTTMQLGGVFGFGNTLYIGWKSEAGTYGIDKVNIGDNPAATGSWESLIDDDIVDRSGNYISSPQKQKESQQIIIKYDTLPTGCTVTPKYKIDREASWNYGTGTDIGTAGSTFCSLEINKRYYEIEYGFDLAATTSYPLITGLVHLFDPLSSESPMPV